jgi:hypothetical protein
MDKEEHKLWLKERETFRQDFVRPTIELTVTLGKTDYWQRVHGTQGRIYPKENVIQLFHLDPYWIVRYSIEHQVKSIQYFKTRDAALFEIDRIMEYGQHDERTVCHCGHCSAMFNSGSVAGLCPMCGTDHNNEDFDKYLGWSIWSFKPADYAVCMYLEWKKHIKWREENGLLPDWFTKEDLAS